MAAHQAQQYYRVNSSAMVTSTQAYFGDGSYTLRGNTITFVRDNKGQPEPGHYRLEEESKDDGRSWSPVLYIMRSSSVDGTEYEVGYKKTR